MAAGKLVEDVRTAAYLLTFKSGREVFMGLAEVEQLGDVSQWAFPASKLPRERRAARP